MSDQLSMSTLGGLLSLNVSMLPQDASGLVSGGGAAFSGFGTLLDQQSGTGQSALTGSGAFLPGAGVPLPQKDAAQILAKTNGLITQADQAAGDDLQQRLLHVAQMLEQSGQSGSDEVIPSQLASGLSHAIKQQLDAQSLPQGLEDELKQLLGSSELDIPQAVSHVDKTSSFSPEQVDELVDSLLAELKREVNAELVVDKSSSQSEGAAEAKIDVQPQLLDKVKQLVAYLDELVAENTVTEELPVPPLVSNIIDELKQYISQQEKIASTEEVSVDEGEVDPLLPLQSVPEEPLLADKSEKQASTVTEADQALLYADTRQQNAATEDDQALAHEDAQQQTAMADKDASVLEASDSDSEGIEETRLDTDAKDSDRKQSDEFERLGASPVADTLDVLMTQGLPEAIQSDNEARVAPLATNQVPDEESQQQVVDTLRKVLVAFADDSNSEELVKAPVAEASRLPVEGRSTDSALQTAPREPLSASVAATVEKRPEPRQEILQLVKALDLHNSEVPERGLQVEAKSAPTPVTEVKVEIPVPSQPAANVQHATTPVVDGEGLVPEQPVANKPAQPLVSEQQSTPIPQPVAAKPEAKPESVARAFVAGEAEVAQVAKSVDKPAITSGQNNPAVPGNEPSLADAGKRVQADAQASDTLIQRQNVLGKQAAEVLVEPVKTDKPQGLLDLTPKSEPVVQQPRVLNDNFFQMGQKLGAAIDAAQQLASRGSDSTDSSPLQKSDLLGLTAASSTQSIQQPTQAQRSVAEGHVLMMPNQVKINTPAWNNALAERAVWVAAQNPRVAEIQLDPPELGSLSIRVQVNQDQVSLSFSSPHAHVRDAVEQSLPRLREMFAEQGLALNDSSVSDQSKDQQRQQLDEGAQSSSGTYAGADGEQDEMQQVRPDAHSVSLVDYYA